MGWPIHLTTYLLLREVRIHLQFGLRLRLFWETLERFVEAQAYRIAYCAIRVVFPHILVGWRLGLGLVGGCRRDREGSLKS